MYEYRVLSSESGVDLGTRLTEFSKAGWELVGNVQVSVASDPPRRDHFTLFVATVRIRT